MIANMHVLVVSDIAVSDIIWYTIFSDIIATIETGRVVHWTVMKQISLMIVLH